MKTFSWFVLCMLMIVPCSAQNASSVKPKHPEIASELIEMGEADQKFRQTIHEQMLKVSQTPGQAELTKEIVEAQEKQSELDAKNLKRLEQIIAQIGWPGKTLVGEKACVAAFLIVQHSELPTQEKYLPVLKEAASKGEVRPADAAMLEDRVLMRQGKKQIYGTQLQSNQESGLKLFLVPIEDEANVDERRAKVGLGPLKDYLKIFGLDYVPPKSN